MLDKTKCSITAKNIYNYICKNYSIYENCGISWNDTLFNNYITLTEFENMKDKNNKIFYVYYDHITGETSHYFILICTNNICYILQSAVFEYSIYDWINNGDTIKNNEINNDINVEKDIEYYRNLFLNNENKNKDEIKSSIKNANKYYSTETIDLFINLLKKLEGSWSSDVFEKCKIFTKLFACNMPEERFTKLFNNEHKCAEFRFRYQSINSITSISIP